MKEKQIYMEGYKKPYPQINKTHLPTLNHLKENFKCCDAVIMKAGVVKRDDEELEFQDIRVYIKNENI